MPTKILSTMKWKHQDGKLPKSPSSVSWASQEDSPSVNNHQKLVSSCTHLNLNLLHIGFLSDFVKNTYNLPRSYLLVLIAGLFFVSQLMLANVANVSHLWIPSSLLGLAHGSLFSLYPTICLDWFGMRAHFISLSMSSFLTYFLISTFFRELGISRLFTLGGWKSFLSRFRTQPRP